MEVVAELNDLQDNQAHLVDAQNTEPGQEEEGRDKKTKHIRM